MLYKRISVFLFAAVYCAGLIVGFFASGWLFPAETAGTGQSAQNWNADFAGQDGKAWQEERTPGYPGRVWGKRLLYQYFLFAGFQLLFLILLRKPGPVIAFWFMAGLTAGAYARGISWLYADCGEVLRRSYIVLAVFPMPFLGSVLSGILWKNREEWLRLPANLPQTKRIRRVLDHIRIRFLQAGVLLAVLLFCYLLDHEIIKRVQWGILFRMLGDGVN